jgi:dienelactone hydrolase
VIVKTTKAENWLFLIQVFRQTAVVCHYIKRIMKRLIVIILFSLAFVSCQKNHLTEINTPFPKPTGGSTVGTEEMSFTKLSEIDSIKDRSINIQLWYPAKLKDMDSYAAYIQDSRLSKAFKDDLYLNLDTAVLNAWDTIQTYAYLKSEVVHSTKKHPLIILSHGFGMSKTNYTVLAIELASHGYIVAAIDHTGSGLTILPNGEPIGLVPNSNGPDGKVVEFCQDAKFVLDELLKTEKFKNIIDQNSAGMLGHSLGGAAALNIGDFDSRFKATANLDGYLFGEAMKIGVKTPFLSILQKPNFAQGSIPDSLKIQRKDEWTGIVDKSNIESHVVNIDGLMHFDFSDLPFIIPDSVRIKNGGTLPAVKEHLIISQLVISFFDFHLKDNKGKLVQNIVNNFDEINYEISNKMAHNTK